MAAEIRRRASKLILTDVGTAALGCPTGRTGYRVLATSYSQPGAYFAALATFVPREFAAYRAMPLYSASAISSR